MDKDKKVVGVVLGLLATLGIVMSIKAKPPEEVSAEIIYASIEKQEGG